MEDGLGIVGEGGREVGQEQGHGHGAPVGASSYAARVDAQGRPLKSALASHESQAARHARKSSRGSPVLTGVTAGPPAGAGHRASASTSSSSTSSKMDLVRSPSDGSNRGTHTSTSSLGGSAGGGGVVEKACESPKSALTPSRQHSGPSSRPSSRRNSELGAEVGGQLAALNLAQPSPQEYDRKVGFDLLGEPLHDAEPNDFSFTLQSKSRDYSRNRNSRTFLVATDVLSHSQNALEWTLDTLIDDGDELVALRVLELNSTSSWGRTKLIDHVRSQEVKARQEAEALMAQIMAHNDATKISIIVEFVVGEVKQTIKSMIAMYRPDSLIMGTRGIKGFKGLLLGSVSKSCISFSPIPVIIVRPERKLAKSKAKRESLHVSAGKNYPELVRSGSATNLGLELSRTRSREVVK